MTADIIRAKNIPRGLGFDSGVWLSATYGLNDSLFIKTAKGFRLWDPLNRMWSNREIWEWSEWRLASAVNTATHVRAHRTIPSDLPPARTQTRTHDLTGLQNTPSHLTTEYWLLLSTRIGDKEVNEDWEWRQWMQTSSRWRQWRGWVDCVWAAVTHRNTITLDHLCLRGLDKRWLTTQRFSVSPKCYIREIVAYIFSCCNWSSFSFSLLQFLA